jgi:hypothetical protein
MPQKPMAGANHGPVASAGSWFGYVDVHEDVDGALRPISHGGRNVSQHKCLTRVRRIVYTRKVALNKSSPRRVSLQRRRQEVVCRR